MSAVTLLQSPDPIALTKGGRMLYRFEGSGRLASAGVNAQLLLIFLNPIADNTKLVLRWKGQAQTILFKASPAQPNEFASGNSSSAYVDDLVTQLSNYFPIFSDFIVSRYDPTQNPAILLTARQPGAAYNITPEFPLVSNPFGYANTVQGADAVIRERYSIWVQVYLQKPGTSGTDLEAHYAPTINPIMEVDANGDAQFDIGEHLHNELQADLPTWNQAAPEVSSLSDRQYYIRYGEAWGFPLQVGKIQLGPVRRAILGGADYIHRAGAGLALTRFTGATPALDLALRYGSATRYIQPGEPQFLTFLNTRQEQALTFLRVTLKFDDGSTAEIDNLYDPISSVPTGVKITFPTGPLQLGLYEHVPAGKQLLEYTVQRLALSGDLISAPYRYLIDGGQRDFVRYFAYLNSLGCIDTLATWGKGSQELALASEQAEKYVPAGYAIQAGQFVDYNISLQTSLEVTSGYRDQSELDNWADFYRSPLRYLLVEGKVLPIGITSKSIKQFKDDDTVFAHKFEFNYLFREDYYTGKEVDNLTEPPPPPTYVPPGGTVQVTVAEIVNAKDDSIDDSVRGINQNRIAGWDAAAARPNPNTLGFMTQGVAAGLFRALADKINYQTDLTAKPNSRDSAGLLDVPTTSEAAHAALKQIFSALPIKAHLSSWTGDTIPAPYNPNLT